MGFRTDRDKRIAPSSASAASVSIGVERATMAVVDSPTDRDLQDLTDRARADDAALARRRRRSLLQQAGEDGTVAGVLADLAERGRAVALHTRAGRSVRGTVDALGDDYVALVGPRGDTSLVPTESITGLRPEPGTRSTVGDRAPRWASSWRGVLADLAFDHPTVALYTVGDDRVPGRLWTVGRDVLAIRGDDASDTYVPLGSINDLALT